MGWELLVYLVVQAASEAALMIPGLARPDARMLVLVGADFGAYCLLLTAFYARRCRTGAEAAWPEMSVFGLGCACVVGMKYFFALGDPGDAAPGAGPLAGLSLMVGWYLLLFAGVTALWYAAIRLVGKAYLGEGGVDR